MERIFQLSWQVPFGALSLKIDPLSIVFLISIMILVGCAGIYALGYMRPYRGKKPLAAHAFFYLALVAAFFFIVTANNVILFLAALEVMTISAFFLIIFQDEDPSIRKAGFIYLIASHCATFFVFLMFFLMAHAAGSMDLDVMARTSFSPFSGGVIFLLALIGFGVKAGFIPLHIWLPHAHPAAPAPVSALLSGVAIKMGIYGICRVIWIMGVLPDWCGYLLLSIGVVSGVMGVLYALGQHELKKLLAYHSIENIGIIALGLGVGLLGRSHNMPFLAVLGFGGALLHVVNHSIFKGLLFLGAGAVIQKTHSGEMDRLGGLSKTMPVTGGLFLVGALSICGLPLFNGFISEFIIYFGLFQGLLTLPLAGVIFCALGIVALALMGALALACFCKVHGTVFLGKPRAGLTGDDPSGWMLVPMMVLAGLCIWIGLAPQTMVHLTLIGGAHLMHAGLPVMYAGQVLAPLTMVIGLAFLFLALMLVLVLVRRFLLGPVPMKVKDTWSCGFTQVSPRFQYSSSSFARQIVDFVKRILLVRSHQGAVGGAFPGPVHTASSVHDASEECLYRPGWASMINISRKIDSGRIRYTQMYLMYIFLFLIFLLVWKLR